MTSMLRKIFVFAATAALAIALLACSNSSDATGPGGGNPSANLTFSASTPANGDATLNAPTVVYDANADASGYDRLTVTQTVGGIDHSFYFYWTPATGAAHSAQHVWGPAGGIAQCVSPACSAANVNVAVAGQFVTFANLVLAEDPLGGSVTSTVSGTITW